MAQILDLGKIRFQFKGEWSSATEYQFNDVVAYKGNTYVYISTAKTTNTLTSNTQFWGRMSNGFDFTGAYAGGTTYGYGSTVRYGGNLYLYTNAVASAGNLPTNTTYWTLLIYGWNFQGAWSSATAYKIGETITHGGIAYVAVQDSTNQNPDNNATYWSTVVQGLQFEGTYNNSTAYQKNDLVNYGSNTYIALTNTVGNLPTNGTYWNLLVGGWNFRSAWSSSTAYKVGDSVALGGTVYVALLDSTNQNPDANPTYWSTLVQGTQWESTYAGGTAYQKNDLVKYGNGVYIAKTNTSGNLPTDSTYWDQFVANDSMASNDVYYVTPTGNDTNVGTSMAAAFASIKAACAAAAITGNPSTIKVSAGTYTEVCPITVPANVAIVGDNQRTVNVQPTSGTNTTTMFLMSNGSILNKMTFKGMTGWVPGTTASDVTTSTIAGVVVRLNPDSPVTTKSPYVIECAAICTGAIGALVDGSVHASGAKTMIFHGYTVISDNGVGYWVKDGGKAEIVSCFTYYCYFGYTSSGGGHIRALNGNNSYGTWGATARGFDSSETPITGTLVGEQLPFVYGGGTITAGDTVSNGAGATATVTNVQYTANKVYIKSRSGTFANGNTLTFTSGGTGTCTGAAENQKGFALVATGFSALPKPGASISVTGDSFSYVVQATTNTWVNSSSEIVLLLAQEKATGSAAGTAVTVRYKYSQVRLTGHDFLSIGTGGTTTTNYPGTPTQASAQGNEVDEAFPGRVFYVSTDQDGNFRVGEYFKIDQATGKATLNASAFDLSGLSSLRLGSIGAQLGEQINEFSSDATLSGNSNLAVPTEYAVKTYVDSSGPLKTRVNVSLASANYTADYTSTLINVTASADFRAVILPSALNASLITSKFQIDNNSAFTIAVRDNTNVLLASIRPGGTALLMLADNATAAGVWGVSGTNLQPFYIKNSVIVPANDATGTNNVVSNVPMFSVNLTANLTVFAHTNATGTASFYAVDYSTIPATVSSTPLVFASGNTYSITSIYRVSDSRFIVFSLTDVWLFSVSGTTITNVTNANGLYTSPVRTGHTTGMLSPVIRFDDEMYGVMFGGAAAAVPVFTIVKVDGDLFRTTTYNLTAANAVVNGWDVIGINSTTALMVYGDSAATAATAPWQLIFVRLVVTKNGSGAAPTVTQSAIASTSGALHSAAAYSIALCKDETNFNNVLVLASGSTTTNLHAYVYTGAVSGSTAVGSAQLIDSALGAVVGTSFGTTAGSKHFRSTAANTWSLVFQGVSSFTRVARITADTTARTTTTVSTLYHPKNPAANIFTVLPNSNADVVAVLSHGQPTTSYSGVFTMVNQSGTYNFKEFVPPDHNILTTTIRTQPLVTSDGWVMIPGALTTTATAVLTQHNQWAIYRVSSGGNVVYYGTFGLPINTNISSIPYNVQNFANGLIRHSFQSTAYDATQNLSYRMAADIEFIKVAS